MLATKPNMRILEDDERRRLNVAERDLKRVMGGLLVQDRDIDLEDRTEMEVVTERKPTERRVGRDAVRLEGLQARALERDRAVQRPRVGRHRRRADEPRRLGAARDREGPRGGHRPARRRAGLATRSSRSPTARSSRSTRASTAIIQPGGSMRDHEVVEAADAAGITMVFTHRRHFKH